MDLTPSDLDGEVVCINVRQVCWFKELPGGDLVFVNMVGGVNFTARKKTRGYEDLMAALGAALERI
jgi:hypothetical protein